MRYTAVVMYCHSKTSVMARFFFRAQDHNMTNGDFAFFTFELWQSSSTDKLWSHYARYVDDSHDLPRRRRAFRALKQVPFSLYSPFVNPGCQKLSEKKITTKSPVS